MESYRKMQEDLKKEERDLQLLLKNEVKKIKESLELYLFEANKYFFESEIINKVLNIFAKDNEKLRNAYQQLYFISSINKINKFTKDFENIDMKSFDVGYNFTFNEYYFNGVPKPKDIRHDIFNNSINIYWEIDRYINIDNNLLKFKVDVKEEGKEFKELYKGNYLNCSITLSPGKKNYEYKVSTIYNGLVTYISDNINFSIKDNDNDNNKHVFICSSSNKNLFGCSSSNSYNPFYSK